ncbi:MAG: YIP1 family protein [Pseudomonadota bacterium]
MDIQKIVTTIPALAAEYFHDFVAILTRPDTRFAPVPVADSDEELIVVSNTSEMTLKSDPKLFLFATLSLCFSISISSASPFYNLDEAPTLIVNVIVGLVAWLIYGSFIHLFSKVLHGRGTYPETISVCVQLFAAISVLGSIFALLLSSELIGDWLYESFTWYPIQLTVNPFLSFFLFQAIALAVYLPISLKRIHRFGALKVTAVAIPSIALVIGLAYVFYSGFGVHPTMASATAIRQSQSASAPEQRRKSISASRSSFDHI